MQKPILLALNIPFCPCRCDYCDKGCHVIGDLQVLDRYADALMREVEASAHQYDDCQVQAVWVGGGMAGHLFDEKLGLLLRRMKEWFSFAPRHGQHGDACGHAQGRRDPAEHGLCDGEQL